MAIYPWSIVVPPTVVEDKVRWRRIRTWQTAVAILSGLSGLIPWRKTGRDFERAHEMLRDAIMLYDADTTYTVMHVLEQAHKAADELHLDERKTPDATSQTRPSAAPKDPHQ